MKVKFYLFLVTKAHRHGRAAIKIHITNFIRIILMFSSRCIISEFQGNVEMRLELVSGCETQTISNCFWLSISLFFGIVIIRYKVITREH